MRWITLLCVAVISSANGQPQKTDERKKADQKPAAKQEVTVTIPVPINLTVSAELQQKAEKNEAKAKEESPKSTDYAIVGLTFVLTILAVIQARLLYAQMRAYVSIGETKKIANALDASLPAYRFHVRNTGLTPARHLKAWTGTGVKPINTTEFGRKDDAQETDASLGAQSETYTAIRKRTPYTDEERRGIEAGTHALFVWGRVEYTTLFRNRCHTNFCFMEDPTMEGLRRHHHRNDAS